jgi:hypothetical protein
LQDCTSLISRRARCAEAYRLRAWNHGMKRDWDRALDGHSQVIRHPPDAHVRF